MAGEKNNNLTRDLGIMVISILLTIVLEKTGAIKEVLFLANGFSPLASLVAGMFFVSIFTVTPATATLIEIAQISSPVSVAIFGGIGALFGDIIIFRFVRDSLSINLLDRLMGKEETWFIRLAKLKTFKYIGPIIGALIIISPFPDELGLALMGLSKIKTPIFVPLAFVLNFIGILGIIYFLK